MDISDEVTSMQQALIEPKCSILLSVLLFTVCKENSGTDNVFLEAPFFLGSWLKSADQPVFYCLFTLDQMRLHLLLVKGGVSCRKKGNGNAEMK